MSKGVTITRKPKRKVIGRSPRLRRLSVGEQVQYGDWCFDERSPQPVETAGKFTVTESTHPHFRIEQA